MSENNLHGEIMSVDMVKKYLLCLKCKKKIDTTTAKMVICQNPNCNEEMKTKFCDVGLFVKFSFISSDKKTHSLTMFQEEVTSLIQGAKEYDDMKALKNKILSFDDLILTKNNGNIVTSVIVKQ